MKKIIFFSLSFIFLIFIRCSSSEETTQSEQDQKEPEIYVFDDITDPVDTNQVEDVSQPPQADVIATTQYYVQVGAFTSQSRADQFVKEKASKTSFQLNITYSEEVRLFVVRLPAFSLKNEAEKVRNEFWQSGLFNDAFIVTQ